MSNVLIEPMLTSEPPLSVNGGEPRPSLWRVWINRLILLAVAIWFVDLGISVLIQHTALKGRLTSRLSAAFGRQVQVRSYSFSLWSGPMLKAQSVAVAEDPRFGNEYFLRAESLSVRIAWRSLLAGHLDLGTVSLTQPSLNLVRNSQGDWNLAEWLPRPSNTPAPGVLAEFAPKSAASVRFHAIEVESGRVNFKRGDDKLPFAFSGVRGTLRTSSSGRWQIDLIATPLRAGSIVQAPGAIHLVGDVGGTSSRLRPAALRLSWSGATVPDVLRLIEGRDYGIRGFLALSASARTEGDSWLMEGKLSLAELHRWDLSFRADNPSASLSVKGKLDSEGSHFDFTDARIDAPHSSARILGEVAWLQPDGAAALTNLRIISAGIGASDLLAWARAFHPNIADDVKVSGLGRADLSLTGWPPQIATGTFDLPHAELTASGLRNPVKAGPLELRYDPKGISLAPITITFGPGGSSFRVDGSVKTGFEDFTVHIQGSAAQANDVVSAASRVGWNLARGWDVAGPVRCDLRWHANGSLPRSELAGSVEWGSPAAGASVHAQFLNLPIEQIRGRAELEPAATHVTLSSAQAFGARWSGTLDHDLSDGWRFSLTADELSAADLDRWLNPLWRESFLDRMLPFLNSHPTSSVSGHDVRAEGNLAIEEFKLAKMPVRHLRGELKLDGRHLEFSNGEGQFEGGAIGGSLEADLVATPTYEAAVDFFGVDVGALAAESPSLANLFSGSASGKLLFTTHGANRGDLVASLECHGSARASDGSIAGFALPASGRGADPDAPASDAGRDARREAPVATPFRDATASFTCADRQIQFQDLLIRGAASAWEGTGTVDFGRGLDLRLRAIAADSTGPRLAKTANSSAEQYRVTGSLASPRIQKVPLGAAENQQ